MNGASDEYDVDDGEFPVNESARSIGNTSRSFSSLLKVGGASKNKKQQPAPAAAPSDQPARRPRPKLDFNRLLKGSRGLGYLAVCTKKNLRLSGKPGGEATDLSQISIYLQEWAKLVFPKMPLVEFLSKVEELCQSRLMKACVPEILSRLKELGDGVSLNDLDSVQGEVMTKLETDEAEKALESIKTGFNHLQTPTGTGASNADNAYHANKAVIDFNLDEILERHQLQKAKERKERPEIIRTDDEEDEEDQEGEGEGEYDYDYDHKEREFFPRDGYSEMDAAESESEAEFSSEAEEKTTTLKRRRGITFNFGDDSDDDSELKQPPPPAQKEELKTTTVETKKRSIGIIMDDSDSDDEQ